MDVVIERRMQMAANLLERSDLKIADVSEQVGYRSEAAFHNRFTTHFGIAPGCFRRKLRTATCSVPPAPSPVGLAAVN